MSDDETPKETAKRLGISRNAVYQQIARERRAAGRGMWMLRCYDGTDIMSDQIAFPGATKEDIEEAFGVSLSAFGSTEWRVVGGHAYFLDFDINRLPPDEG